MLNNQGEHCLGLKHVELLFVVLHDDALTLVIIPWPASAGVAELGCQS
jgi:hypothetical protein